MALSNALGHLEKVYELATSDVPDAIERAAEMTHGLELAMKDFAAWLRNLSTKKPKVMTADQEAEVDGRIAALVTKASASLHDKKLMAAGEDADMSPESWLIIILKVAELFQKWRNR